MSMSSKIMLHGYIQLCIVYIKTEKIYLRISKDDTLSYKLERLLLREKKFKKSD